MRLRIKPGRGRKLGKPMRQKDLPVQVILEIDRAKEKPTLHLEQILLGILDSGSNITGNSRLNNGYTLLLKNQPLPNHHIDNP